MAEKTEVEFYVGETKVFLDIVDGQAGALSCEDADGKKCEGEFVFLHLVSGKCKICRRISGVWTCEDILCNVVDVGASSEMKY